MIVRGKIALERKILHVDADSFYASVECLYHPSLRNKPVAVCGDEEQRHGIILAKNQPAKKYGVKAGEAIWQARAKCRDLVLLPARYDLYMKFSGYLREIYSYYTDQIENFGLDECWCDVSGSVGLLGQGIDMAKEISATVRRELGITVSVGIAWNKIFAKLGSDYRKPNGITEFTKENFRELIWPRPASDLLYVGPATSRKLGNYGIRTIGQLAQMDANWLRRLLGKWGVYLWQFANGLDITPVSTLGAESAIKSVGNSITTQRDVEDFDEAWQVILSLSESVSRRLRENALRCRVVEVSYRDNQLIWNAAQKRLSGATCLTDDISKTAYELLKARYSFSRPLRAIGVRGSDVVGVNTGIQTSLLSDPVRQERREKIEGCVDQLRKRFGMDSIQRASLLHAGVLGESDPLTHVVHPVAYFR